MNKQKNIDYSCVSKVEMVGFIKNKLNEESAIRIHNHIESCEYCNEAFTGLKQLPDFTSLNSLPVLWKKRISHTIPDASLTRIKLFSGISAVVILISTFIFFNADFRKENLSGKPTGGQADLHDTLISQAKIVTEQEAELVKNTPIASETKTSKEELLNETHYNKFEKTIPPIEAFIMNNNLSANVNFYNKKIFTEKIIYLENLKTLDYTEKYSGKTFSTNAILNNLSAKFENKEAQENALKDQELKTHFISYAGALSAGLKKYNNKFYKEAIRDFDLILEQFPADINCRFYIALCREATGNFHEAEKLYLEFISEPENIFYEESKWHLALCKAELKDFVAARRILEQIVSDNSFYKNQAEKFLIDIE